MTQPNTLVTPPPQLGPHGAIGITGALAESHTPHTLQAAAGYHLDQERRQSLSLLLWYTCSVL